MIPQVTLPLTDLRVSRLGLGTASLHHVWSQVRRQRILSVAASSGVTHFDTSPLYGFGLAELELGRFLASNSTQATVATKIGLYPPPGSTGRFAGALARKAFGRLCSSLSKARADWSVRVAAESLERSLRRLRRDCIDVLFLHEPRVRDVDPDVLLGFLEGRRRAGVIRWWGLAGEPEGFLPWVAEDHPIARVLQLRDSLGGDPPRALAAAGRDFQFTYGYLARAGSAAASTLGARATIQAALRRNTTGCVLVSTRRANHLEQLVDAAAVLSGPTAP